MLGTDNIYLRALEPDDLDTVFRWENSPGLWDFGSTTAPVSRQLLYDYISNYEADIFAQKQLRLIIVEKKSGLPAGVVDLTSFDPANRRTEVGILIDTPYRRKGYGYDTLILVENYCRTVIGIHQLWCIISEDNTPSRRLFEKAGYKSNGRLRSWLRRGNRYTDAYVYQLIL